MWAKNAKNLANKSSDYTITKINVFKEIPFGLLYKQCMYIVPAQIFQIFCPKMLNANDNIGNTYHS